MKRLQRFLNRIFSPERCTAVDARKLRQINHGLADEIDRLENSPEDLICGCGRHLPCRHCKPSDDLFAAIVALQASEKPQCLHIDSSAVETLESRDALSITATVFRNGGTINGVPAVPFCKVTPEIRAVLRLVFQANAEVSHGANNQ